MYLLCQVDMVFSSWVEKNSVFRIVIKGEFFRCYQVTILSEFKIMLNEKGKQFSEHDFRTLHVGTQIITNFL